MPHCSGAEWSVTTIAPSIHGPVRRNDQTTQTKVWVCVARACVLLSNVVSTMISLVSDDETRK